MSSDVRIVRVYDLVRTVHLERFAQMRPARVLTHGMRYDYDSSLVSAESAPSVVSRREVPLHLLRTDYDVVELNEPVMNGRWSDLAASIAAIRLRDLVKRRHTDVVAYCIGVDDPAEHIAARRPVPRALLRPWSALVMRGLVRSCDRLAFGTTGALDLYRGLAGDASLRRRARTFEALPSACSCLDGSARIDGELLFVGAFEPRKGIRELMAAWEHVPTQLTGARLRLIGKGQLADEVLAWAKDRAEVTVEVDPARARIHEAERHSRAMVLLSQRTGLWREQVGLPIVEALAHGARVVTTSETGLADWLGRHGHHVVSPAAGPQEIAAQIVAALSESADPATVLADLPEADSRLAADEWMVTGRAFVDGEPAQQTPMVVAFGPGAGPQSWARRHAASPVPGRWPYGLDELSRDGREVTPVELPAPGRLASRLERQGMRPGPRARHGEAVAMCWDERLADSMLRHVPARRHASGVIWATDQDPDDPVLRRLAAVLRRLDGLWTLSRPQVEAVRAWLGDDCPPVRFVPFGVDPSFYAPRPAPGGPPRVVSVGGDRDRDPQTLLEALRRVRQERPDVECLVQSRTALAVPEGISVVGQLPHVQVAELLASSSVVALAMRPNLHVSGMTVALEAAATARPTVVCDTPGMDDYVVDGQTGLVVPPQDPQAMARSILMLLDDRERADQLGATARERVLAEHTTAHLCAHLGAWAEDLW